MKFPKKNKKIGSMLTSKSKKLLAKAFVWAYLVGTSNQVLWANTHYNHSNSGTTSNYTISYNSWVCTATHMSGIVNWHFSGTSSTALNGGWITWVTWHSSHGSHANHCSCTRWM